MPDLSTEAGAVFLKQLQSSGHKWAVVTDTSDKPRLIVDTDGFLRSALLEPESFDAFQYCHSPIIVTDTATRIGHILQRFEVQPGYQGDNVIDRDVVLIWNAERRVITGADILGRLLTGISRSQ